MQLLITQTALMVVTALYLVWRTYDEVRTRRQQTLRQRVAYMLWVMAERVEPYVAVESD
jgi:hypothetical protein